MKGVLWVIAILLLLLFVAVPLCEAECIVTEYKSEESEQFLWDTLSENSPSDEVTAGILAYFWRESFYRSDSVTGWAALAQSGFNLCEYVVSKTDDGLDDGSSKEWFIETVRSCGGFGLGQWYAYRYLEPLYDFAQSYGTSIADAEMQCAFVMESIQSNTELWEALLECKSARKAGELIGLLCDGSVVGYEYMGYKADEIYGRMVDDIESEVAK